MGTQIRKKKNLVSMSCANIIAYVIYFIQNQLDLIESFCIGSNCSAITTCLWVSIKWLILFLLVIVLAFGAYAYFSPADPNMTSRKFVKEDEHESEDEEISSNNDVISYTVDS